VTVGTTHIAQGDLLENPFPTVACEHQPGHISLLHASNVIEFQNHRVALTTVHTRVLLQILKNLMSPCLESFRVGLGHPLASGRVVLEIMMIVFLFAGLAPVLQPVLLGPIASELDTAEFLSASGAGLGFCVHAGMIHGAPPNCKKPSEGCALSR
jgi:hypothetical protein